MLLSEIEPLIERPPFIFAPGLGSSSNHLVVLSQSLMAPNGADGQGCLRMATPKCACMPKKVGGTGYCANRSAETKGTHSNSSFFICSPEWLGDEQLCRKSSGSRKHCSRSLSLN
jgi:hypothetical protein